MTSRVAVQWLRLEKHGCTRTHPHTHTHTHMTMYPSRITNLKRATTIARTTADVVDARNTLVFLHHWVEG